MTAVLRIRTALIGAAVSAALISSAAAQPAQPAAGAKPGSNVKVGLVFDVGGLGDKSFNDSAYAGLKKAQDELGVKGEYREPGEGSQRTDHLRNLARGDANLLIGVGFLFTDAITEMAEELSGKKFACVDYTVTGEEIPENLAALTFREEEGSFLVGAIAALMSKSGKIGFVGGVESPLIKKFEAGYTQGAKHVKPEVQVRAAYAGVSDNAFKDPQKGKELAASMYDAGVDIIFHASGSTGLGVFKAAEERGKHAIGVDADQSGDAKPGVIITSMTKNTDQAVHNVIKQTVNGTFKGGVQQLGLKEGGVGYVYNKELIPADVHQKIEDLKKKIISGEIKVQKTAPR